MEYLEDLSSGRLQPINALALLSPDCPDWIDLLSMAPRGPIRHLNSQACREAIMFNDTLADSEAIALIKGLAQCHFP